MADLPEYTDIDNKRKFFSNGDKASFIIDTKKQLESLFNEFQTKNFEENKIDSTSIIYRGATEAKYKLLTSSQRIWINDEMEQWSKKNYADFIISLVQNSKNNSVIKKVFDLYNYSDSDREFPILSLLQHYGAPTPLMDWTYNSKIAFFFATDGLKKKELPKRKIDDYFSIYRINKKIFKGELLNIIDFIPGELYPELNAFRDIGESGNANVIFYISDFERKGESKGEVEPFKNLLIRTRKPLTSIYNQNIITQEGLFIFNPFSDKTLEDIFNVNLNESGWNLSLSPFECFNIHKDLAEYLKRSIDVNDNINKSFIYPNLNDEAKRIKEKTINDLIK